MRCLWWGRIRSGMTWPADGDLKRSSCEWPVAGTQQSGGWCVSPEIQGAGIWASTNVPLSRKHLSWDQNDMIVFTPGVIVLTLHPHLPLWSSERQSNLLHITQLTRSNASCLPAQGCFLYDLVICYFIYVYTCERANGTYFCKHFNKGFGYIANRIEVTALCISL